MCIDQEEHSVHHFGTVGHTQLQKFKRKSVEANIVGALRHTTTASIVMETHVQLERG